MGKKYIRKSKFFKQIFCVAIFVVMISTSFVTSMEISTSRNLDQQSGINIKSISYSYKFDKPKIKTTSVSDSKYSLIEMSGCINTGKYAGEPLMPVNIIRLLIPPMKDVANVNVIGNPVEIDLVDSDLVKIPVFPYQDPVPFGNSIGEFVINTDVYESSNPYPSNIKENYHIGYSRGYAILDLTVNPVQYIPSEGRIFYYPEIAIDIELKDTNKVNQFFRNSFEDKAWVEKLVDNPEIANDYQMNTLTLEYEGGLCDPSDEYDYVIITTEHNDLDYWDTNSQIPYNWESLLDRHNNEGLSSTLVTIQQIDACEDYFDEDPMFNDLQAHIREFCKDAFQDWGTSYIFIGGDDEWIPARHMRYQYESNADSDIYWSNLDKTFNADHDNYWGEEGDTGFDVYAEIFIGRITCDEPQDVSNWMKKSFYYADNLDEEYLDNAAFYGGDTTWPCQGDDFMDYSAIKGTDDWLGPDPDADGPFPEWAGFQFGFETWNEEHPDDMFDLSVMWTAEPPNPGWNGGNTFAAINGLKEDINNDKVTVMSGIAHADSYKSLDVESSSWESNYHNTKPFFLHDYGCHCGDMDASDDGVLHSMLFHSDTELAFGVVYNTVFGWGNFQTTNSSSAFQAKSFWDYFLDLENSGYPTNWELGKAHAWSKDIMAPTLDWDPQYGTWRGIIQGCLLFADPAQKLKNPHPNLPPEKPPAPAGPTEWAQFGEATFTCVANDPEDDSLWFMLDWGDGTLSDWIGPFGSGQSGKVHYIWTEVGTYKVKVRARDKHYGQSDWSEPATLVIVENQGPNIPIITGSTSAPPKKLLTFTFSAEDPEGNDIYYKVSWGDGNIESFKGPYSSGEEITLNHAWGSVGDYTIVCFAKDMYNAVGSQAFLKLKITTSRARYSQPLLRIIESLLSRLPILERLLYK